MVTNAEELRAYFSPFRPTVTLHLPYCGNATKARHGVWRSLKETRWEVRYGGQDYRVLRCPCVRRALPTEADLVEVLYEA